MTGDQGLAVGRRRLRTALRKAREAAGLTRHEVATAMDWSLSKVIRIEAGTVSVTTVDMRALLSLYGVDDTARVAELLALARNSRARTWWSELRDHLAPSYLAYIGLEDETTEVMYFAPTSLPNLLQTEEYATSPAAERPAAAASARDVETQLRVRLIRQRKMLGKDPPPRVTAIIDEAVLRRIADGPHRIRGQLSHLASLGASPHITIQILPFSAGPPPVAASFAILRFPDPAVNDVMYVENAFSDDVIDRPEVVTPYRTIFEGLRSAALSPVDSLSLIRQIAGESVVARPRSAAVTGEPSRD